MIGYLLLQALENALPGQQIVGLITQTLVAADDPALGIQRSSLDLSIARAKQEIGRAVGIQFDLDGERWRRVVPSPEPQGISNWRPLRSYLRLTAPW